MKIPVTAVLVCSVMLAGLSRLVLADEIKMIFAPETSTPPKIDGVLDEAGWQVAETHADFISLTGDPAARTTMRALYDANHLYVGIACDWREVAALKKGVAAIVEKHPQALKFVHFEEFVNTHSVELFLDPGATRTSHYQILANAAGQSCGHYKMNWDPFPEKPLVRATVSAHGWTVEFSISAAALQQPGLRAGDKWGFNLVRNDARPAAIWKMVAPDFNTPSMFGLMILGDYQTWWRQAVGNGIVTRFGELARRMNDYQPADPQIAAMHKELLPLIEQAVKEPRCVRMKTRRDFVVAWEMYDKLNRLFGRFDALCRTVELAADKQK